MIRTQVRCDKRVSFRDRREGWTCVCPSPGVARTHVATRTESLEPGTLGKHGPGPRHRPYEVVGAKEHQHRLQPRRLTPGVQDHSIKLRQLTWPILHTPLRHRRTPGKFTKPRRHHWYIFLPLRRHLVILSTGQYTGNSSSNPTHPAGSRTETHHS